MRLAYLNPAAVPATGAATLQILYTVDAMGDLGAVVDVVTPAPRGAPPAVEVLGRPLSPGVTLHPQFAWRRRWFFPLASHRPFHWQAVRWLRRHAVDAVYVRHLRLADVLLDTPGLPPLFFETHELFAQSFVEAHPGTIHRRARALRALRAREARVYRDAAGLVAITRALLDDIRETYGVRTPAVIAPDGVDLARAAEAVAAVRSSDGAAGDPVLLYVGSLHPWKGVETLIDAMPFVAHGTLWIAGGVRDRIDALAARATRLGVAARVRFCGPIAPRERFDLIQRAQICVLPLSDASIARRYTSPLKLFEYMALGKPIVAGDVPAIREVVGDGDTALLAPPGQPRAFAERIRRLLEEPALARRIGAAARRRAQAYSWQARASTIQAFVQGAVARAGPA